MKNVTTPTTLLEAVKYFSNDAKCVKFIEKFRWADGKPCCPNCGSLNVCYLKTRPSYRCRENGCKKTFSLKTGSIMTNSPLPITKWVPAIWFIINHKNGVSSYEVARALGITQKAAWHLCHRIRKAVSNGSFEKLKGQVEIDETYLGGKSIFMHKGKREALNMKQGRKRNKTVVMGMIERGGEVRAKVVNGARKNNLLPEVMANISPDAEVYTDKLLSYENLGDHFAKHGTVDHGKGEYVNGDSHTNTMEMFWSLFKRSVKGTYIHIAPFHADRYLDEQSFRYNYRKLNDAQRFETVMPKIFGANKQLPYSVLTGKLAA